MAELAKLIAADMYLTEQEHGWRCDRCLDERKASTTCIVCGAPYEETTVDKQGNQQKRVFAGTEALDEIKRVQAGP